MYIKSTVADFVVAQETKTQSGPAKDQAESAMAMAKWKTSIGPCMTTTALGKACGVAVSCRSHIGLSTKDATDTVLASKTLASRLQVRHVGAVFKGGLPLGSVCCHSGIGINATANLRLLEENVATLKGIAGRWIIGCDANCTPQALQYTDWLKLVGGMIHAPDHATCNDKIYDFFITPRCCAHAVRRVVTVIDAEFKPRHPARMWLDARPRMDKFRQLTNRRKFAAWLQYGPLTAEHHAPAPDVDALGADPVEAITKAWIGYAEIIIEVEEALACIKGLDGTEAAKHTGRAEGSSFRINNAAGRGPRHLEGSRTRCPELGGTRMGGSRP